MKTAKSSTGHLSISVTQGKIAWHCVQYNLASLVISTCCYFILWTTREFWVVFLNIRGNSTGGHWCIWHILRLSVLVVAAELWSCMEFLTHSLLNLPWKSWWKLWSSHVDQKTVAETVTWTLISTGGSGKPQQSLETTDRILWLCDSLWGKWYLAVLKKKIL